MNRLASCETGNGDDSFAQQLSKELVVHMQTWELGEYSIMEKKNEIYRLFSEMKLYADNGKIKESGIRIIGILREWVVINNVKVIIYENKN